jgi:predicted Rossmann fold nucleotide-binding protein DprA/Smf involved in DNA uptake
MAINPNTNFVAGAILTADQQNRFGRGVMSYTQSTTSDTSITATEEVQITATAFTAVANRFYKITYFEPQLSNPSSTYFVARIRETNLAGAELEIQINSVPAALFTGANVVAVRTFTAGSVTIVGTLESTGTGSATRSATRPAYILVEDIGPA